ncbi:MAG: MFS transporter [Phenylobacterium sp.]|nr:MFS transporter [Phenylobacterium sp.]
MAPPAGAAPERLPLRIKLGFGLGGAAETVVLYSVSSFALLFYSQVMGVPAHLVGLALSASLILDAFSDPVVGSISDRTRSRWGRRHPYLFGAAIPIGLTGWAIFSPPAGLDQTGLLLWLGVSVILMRQSMTFFYVPHLALGAELSPHYTERSKVMSYFSFFNWAGGSLTTILALRLFFPSTPEYPRGLLNPAPWSSYAVTIGVITTVCLLASAWLTRDRIPLLPQAAEGTKLFSFKEFFGDLGKALRNINYVWLLVAYFFVALMIGLREGLRLYAATFYWDLSSETLSWFVLGSLVGYVSAFIFAPRLHGSIDKKRTIMLSALAYAAIPPIPLVLGMMGILSPSTPNLALILIAFAAVQYGAISILQISVMSALADVADENELKFGVRQEGVLYATRTLAGKIDLAIGTALAGAVITLIQFPRDAKVRSDIPDQVLFDLALWDSVLAAIPGVIAVGFYALYGINRDTYQATRAALDARRAAATPSRDTPPKGGLAPAPAE